MGRASVGAAARGDAGMREPRGDAGRSELDQACDAAWQPDMERHEYEQQG